MAEVTDTEVAITGLFGIGSRTPVTDFWLILGDGTEIPVVFDPLVADWPRFDGCFYRPGHGGTPCPIRAHGYLRWQGATLQAVLSTIEELSPPEVPK